MDPLKEQNSQNHFNNWLRTLRSGNLDQYQVKQIKDRVIPPAFAASTTYGSAFNVLESKIKSAPYWKETQYLLRIFGSEYCLKNTPLVYQFLLALYEEQNPYRALLAFNNMIAAYQPNMDQKFYNFCGYIFNLALFTKNPETLTPFIVEALQLFDPSCAQKMMNEGLKNLVHYYGSSSENEKALLFWVNQGADIYIQFPLHRDHREIVMDLTKEGTLIHLCFIRKYPDLMRLLIQKRFDLSKLNHWSFVHVMALKEEFQHLITLWINIYRNPDVKDIEGNTLLHLALVRKKKALAELLLSAGAKLLKNNRGETPLHVDQLQDPEILGKILEKYPHAAEEKDKFGKTPLHSLCVNELYYEKLLTGSRNVNIACNAGLKPIQVQPSISLITLLVKRDAQFQDVRGANGNTLLHMALMSQQKDLAILLINKGAKLLTNNQGETPLHVDKLQDPEVIRLILRIFPQAVSVKDHLGRTPLHVMCNNPEYYAALLQGCENVNMTCNAGQTPVHVQQNVEIFRLLEAKGADLHVEDGKGRNAVHYLHDLDVYRYLFEEHSIDINAKDEEGHTPIHNLFRGSPSEWPKIVEYLSWIGGELDPKTQAEIMKEYCETDSANCLALFHYYPIDWTSELPFEDDKTMTPFAYVWKHVPDKLSIFLEKYDSPKLQESFFSYLKEQTAFHLEIYKQIGEMLAKGPQPVLKKYLVRAVQQLGDYKLLIEAGKSAKIDTENESFFSIAWKENVSLQILEFILHKNPELPNRTIFRMCQELMNLKPQDEKYQKNLKLLTYILTTYIFSAQVRQDLVKLSILQNKDLFDLLIINEEKAQGEAGKEKYLWDACFERTPDHVRRLMQSELPYQPYLSKAMHFGIMHEDKTLILAAKRKGISFEKEGKALLELAIKENKQKALAILIECGAKGEECLTEAFNKRHFGLAALLVLSGVALSPRDKTAATTFNFVVNSVHSPEQERKEFLKAFFKDYPYVLPIIDFHPIARLRHEITQFLNNQHIEPAVIVPVNGEGSLFDLFYLFDLMELSMSVANQLNHFQLALAMERLVGRLPEAQWDILENMFAIQPEHMRRGQIIEELPVIILPPSEMKKAFRKIIEEGPSVFKIKDIIPKHVPCNSDQEVTRQTVLRNLDDLFLGIEARSIRAFKPNTSMSPCRSKFEEQLNIPLTLQMMLDILKTGHKDALGLVYLLSVPDNRNGYGINQICVGTFFEFFLDQFEKAFDLNNPNRLKIEEIDDDGKETTIDKMRDGLKRLFNGIIDRIAVTGTSPTDSAELEVYYSKLQRSIYEVARLYKESQDISAQKFCIQELALAGIHCGGRWMGVTNQQKMLLMNIEPPSFQDAIYEELRRIRFSVLEQVFTERLRALGDFNREHSVHIFNQLLGTFGQELGLHNSKQFQGYPDAYNERNLNVNQVKLQFFSKYHLGKIAKQVLDSIVLMYKKTYQREILTKWVTENLPEEFKGDFHGFMDKLIYDEETNKFRLGFILYVMLEEDILLKTGKM